MRPFRVALAMLLTALVGACTGGLAPVNVSGVTLGGDNYAPQYDFSEFWAATDNRTFRVVFAGNPFPSLPVEQVKQRLLPVMQANKPRPNLTFVIPSK